MNLQVKLQKTEDELILEKALREKDVQAGRELREKDVQRMETVADALATKKAFDLLYLGEYGSFRDDLAKAKEVFADMKAKADGTTDDDASNTDGKKTSGD